MINDGGYPTDVERQGHGLQRTLVIAVLQELADALAADGSAGSEAPPAKSLMLAIEEPELYQHPLQARTLAAALRDLARAEGETRAPQIAYSTHSEHFVRPALFEDLRIVSRGDSGASSVVATDPNAVQSALEAVGMIDQERQVRLTLASSLSQAVFAKGVVLCEGKTDAAMLEAVAAVDRPLEHDGVAVANCHGKSIVPIALAILAEFEIPTFVLFDADAQARSRLEANGNLGDDARQKAIVSIATKNEQLLTLSASHPLRGRSWRCASAPPTSRATASPTSRRSGPPSSRLADGVAGELRHLGEIRRGLPPGRRTGRRYRRPSSSSCWRGCDPSPDPPEAGRRRLTRR